MDNTRITDISANNSRKKRSGEKTKFAPFRQDESRGGRGRGGTGSGARSVADEREVRWTGGRGERRSEEERRETASASRLMEAVRRQHACNKLQTARHSAHSRSLTVWRSTTTARWASWSDSLVSPRRTQSSAPPVSAHCTPCSTPRLSPSLVPAPPLY